jgi:UDP-N-acetylglucosamine 2-epimerase (non-hydrolysing)
MLKVITVVGARPNFMKVAPVAEAMRRRAAEFCPLLVHTGQHYDAPMSEVFLRDLGLPRPDVHLGVGSGSHAQQTALVMQRFEPVVLDQQPDWVVVVGDVNSTLACALVCAKLGVRVAHVEAGLRSRDRAMPEEINRLLTDQLSDLLLTPSADADRNLLSEGIEPARIRLVGNVMIDSLFGQLGRAEASRVREVLGLTGTDYAVVTLHRPSNVDDPRVLGGILAALTRIGGRLPVVFPTRGRGRTWRSSGCAGRASPAGACGWSSRSGTWTSCGSTAGRGWC